MPAYPAAAVDHDAAMKQLQARAVGAGRAAWRRVSLDDLSGSWQAGTEALQPAIEAVQHRAAVLGAGYGAYTLAQQGTYSAPLAFVDPSGFVGSAPDGRPLAGLLYSPVTQMKTAIANGVPPESALTMGRGLLDRNLQTLVADTGRAAASVDIVARPQVGYVRMLNLPSCPRCVILAGRFYRWNTGFLRHPRCDCRHIPSTENRAGDATTDPYEYFRSLTAEEQDKQFGKPSAQAIRDGSDIFQVVNAKRGTTPGGLVTKEGTSRRGNYGRGRPPRLTPEGIYAQGLPRDETLRLLERNGYILPGGQNPAGVIRGQAEGYGALGRGGTRVGARNAVEEARRTGIRNPATRATMTEAERRAFDARANWDAVNSGRNPYTNRKSAKVTPEVAARAEADYRRELTLKPGPTIVREVIDVLPKPKTAVTAPAPKPLAGQELADTITYESTYAMTDGDLAAMMSKYADDPAVFDKIMEVMDERDAKFLSVETFKTGKTAADISTDPPEPVDLDPSPVTNPAARKERNLTQREKASEEYQNYAMAQYSRALDDLNGVLLNKAGKARARELGVDLEIDIFTGSAVTARKYASEELLRWWEEQGRETLASFRYKMYGWDTDRRAAMNVRNMGYERGQAFRDRSQF